MSPKSTRLVTLVVLSAIVAGAGYWYFTGRNDAVQQKPNLEELTFEAFSQKVIASNQVLLLDVRPKAAYAEEHIPDSVSIPSYEVGSRIPELKLFAPWEVILVDDSGEGDDLSLAARDLQHNGFEQLFYLTGGFGTYKDAGMSVASDSEQIQTDLANLLSSIEVPELSVGDLKKRLAEDGEGVVVIDGRTSFEFVTGFIPGAKNIPLHTFGASMERGFIPRDKTIVVYDRVGNRAKIGVQALLDAGYTDVLNLTGGIEAWTAADGETALPKEDGSDLPDLIPVLYPEE